MRATGVKDIMENSTDQNTSGLDMNADQMENNEDMDDNFVSTLLGSYFERFSSVVNAAHSTFLEHNQRLQTIKMDIAVLDQKVLAMKRACKKRMQGTVEMTDALSDKIRRIATSAVSEEESDDEDNTYVDNSAERENDEEGTVVL